MDRTYIITIKTNIPHSHEKKTKQNAKEKTTTKELDIIN